MQTRQQRRKQRDTPLPGISPGNNKSVMCPPIICLPPEEGKKSEQQCCSKTASDDDFKLERSNSRKTVDTEYSFEEVILFNELVEYYKNIIDTIS